MQRGPDRYDPRAIEENVRRFWRDRSLPPPSGVLGAPSAPAVHQLISPPFGPEADRLGAHRLVLVDAEARYLALSGQRVRLPATSRPTRPATEGSSALPIGDRLDAWTAPAPTSAREGRAITVQAMIDRLASENLLVQRETPMRSCPNCRSPRAPPEIVYLEEEGVAFLVRFRLSGSDPGPSLLVWTDALWKLLGTTAVLVSPDLPYVTARFRRRGEEDLVVASRASLARLAHWLPGAEFEVVDEAPGRSLEGRRYDHPLAAEMPMLAGLPDPSGAVHASAEVTDSGTGVVALVPRHGPTDHAVADSLGIEAWTVLDPDLTLARSFVHKYQGLPIDAAEAFIARDLTEGRRLFAQLAVRRGVPHCGRCGAGLVWESGRVWCLEPGRLPADRLELLGRLLPDEPLPPATEPVAWPATERSPSRESDAPELLECPSCDRLAPVGATGACPCGGTRVRVRRRLLPFLAATLDAWARELPFPDGDAVRLYVPERRRLPALVHHLLAMESAAVRSRDVRLRLVASPGAPETLEPPAADEPLDATRVALLALAPAGRGTSASFADRRRREARRLRQLWSVGRSIGRRLEDDRLSSDAVALAARLQELRPEDRAFLSTVERLRSDVRRWLDGGEWARAQRRLADFFETGIVQGYLPLVASRLEADAIAERATVYAVLTHALTVWSELYAPFAPHAAETLHRQIAGERTSLFEGSIGAVQESLLDASLERSYERWRTVVAAIGRVRRAVGVAAHDTLPLVVIQLTNEERATELRAQRDVLGRIANVARLEVASPDVPWAGRQLTVEPDLTEIQRVFGTAAGRVVRLLTGLPGRRVQEGLRTNRLEVTLDGRTLQVSPTMVHLVDALPPGMVQLAWEAGEMFVEPPPGSRGSVGSPLPALSPDGMRFVREIRRRLQRGTTATALPGIAVWSTGKLTDEIERHRTELARFLGVPELQSVGSPETFPREETVRGRSGRGDRWAAWIPGIPRRSRAPKRRARQPSSRRVAPDAAGDGGASAVDFLADHVLEREAMIDDWVHRLDTAVGRPLVGPAKLRYAVEAGFRSYDEFTSAPYDRLSAIPGFGPQVAGTIVRTFGGPAPPARSAGRGPLTYDPAADRRGRAVPEEPAPVPVADTDPATDDAPTPRAPEPPPPAPVVEVTVEEVPAGVPEAVVSPPPDPGPRPAVDPQGADEVARTDAGTTTLFPPPAEPGIPGPGPEDEPPVNGRESEGSDARTDPDAGGDMAPAGAAVEERLQPEQRAGPTPEDEPAIADGEVPTTESTVDSPTAEATAPSSPAPPEEEPLAPAAGFGGRAAMLPSEDPPKARVEPDPAPTARTTIEAAPPAATPPADHPAVVPALATAMRSVDPAPAAPPGPSPGLAFSSGVASNDAWRLFLDATGAGHRGLCVSREFPDRMRALLGPRDVSIVWISTATRAGSIRPNDLDALRSSVERAVTQEGVGAVYIDSIEYLIRINSLGAVLDLLREVDRLVKGRLGRAWIPINPLLIAPADADRLADAFPAAH